MKLQHIYIIRRCNMMGEPRGSIQTCFSSEQDAQEYCHHHQDARHTLCWGMVVNGEAYALHGSGAYSLTGAAPKPAPLDTDKVTSEEKDQKLRAMTLRNLSDDQKRVLGL